MTKPELLIHKVNEKHRDGYITALRDIGIMHTLAVQGSGYLSRKARKFGYM